MQSCLHSTFSKPITALIKKQQKDFSPTAPFVEQQTHCAMTATFNMTKTQTAQLIQKHQTELVNFVLHEHIHSTVNINIWRRSYETHLYNVHVRCLSQNPSFLINPDLVLQAKLQRILSTDHNLWLWKVHHNYLGFQSLSVSPPDSNSCCWNVSLQIAQGDRDNWKNRLLWPRRRPIMRYSSMAPHLSSGS